MAEPKVAYPIVTEQRWWALRDRFRKSLPARVTAAYLQSVLDISPKTATAVEIPTLKRLGLISKEGAPTDLAKKWRDDHQYADACTEIRSAVYPEELQHTAPDPEKDEGAAVRWFMNQGEVGEKAARYMARTYRLLSGSSPKEAGDRPEPRRKSGDDGAKQAVRAAKPRAAPIPESKDLKKIRDLGASQQSPTPSLHIDVQVHIAADATPEQIDQIFASMSKHLYGRNE